MGKNEEDWGGEGVGGKFCLPVAEENLDVMLAEGQNLRYTQNSPHNKPIRPRWGVET